MSLPSVTITGTLTDLTGSDNAGKIKFILVNYGGQPPTVSGTGMLAKVVHTVQADANGDFSVTLWGNHQINPAGTYYQVEITDATGSQVVVTAYQFLAGGTFDISELLPAASVPKAPGLISVAKVALTGDYNDLINKPNVVGGGGSGGGVLISVPFSATPSFDVSAGDAFEFTLTGNVTSSTAANAGSVAGKLVTFVLIQDFTGGRTLVWPTNVKNASDPDPSPNAISVQQFIVCSNGNLYPTGPMTIN